jgi:hypothetical protein
MGWAALRKLKTEDNSNESLLCAGTTDAPMLLLGLPVLKSRFITPYDGLDE